MVSPFFYAKVNKEVSMILFHCADCGYEAEYETEENAQEDGWWQDGDGDWYCNDCNCCCLCCDDYHRRADCEWSESQDGYICDGCRDEYYNRCEFCCQLYDSENDEGTWVYSQSMGHDIYVCQHCFENQVEQGKITHNDELNRWEHNPNGMTGGHVFQEHLHPEVWTEINNCPDCQGNNNKCARCLHKMAKEVEAEETTLWVYDTMPRSYHPGNHHHFKQTKLRQKHEHPFLYYGIEWEVLFRDSSPINQIAKEFIEATHGLFVAEFDRSVSDQGNGIEFISRPLSYKKWMEESTYQLLEAGKAVLDKYHLICPQPVGCGLHVHMSLQFFERNTQKSVKKIKSDIDWMFQIYQSEIEKISQRPYTKYCASKAFRLRQVMKDIRCNGYGFNLNPQVSISKGE